MIRCDHWSLATPVLDMRKTKMSKILFIIFSSQHLLHFCQEACLLSLILYLSLWQVKDELEGHWK